MNAHIFVTVLDDDDEVEIRILYESFMVSLYKGDVEVNHYDRIDYRMALQCHRNSDEWEEQLCSW